MLLRTAVFLTSQIAWLQLTTYNVAVVIESREQARTTCLFPPYHLDTLVCSCFTTRRCIKDVVRHSHVTTVGVCRRISLSVRYTILKQGSVVIDS